MPWQIERLDRGHLSKGRVDRNWAASSLVFLVLLGGFLHFPSALRPMALRGPGVSQLARSGELGFCAGSRGLAASSSSSSSSSSSHTCLVKEEGQLGWVLAREGCLQDPPWHTAYTPDQDGISCVCFVVGAVGSNSDWLLLAGSRVVGHRGTEEEKDPAGMDLNASRHGWLRVQLAAEAAKEWMKIRSGTTPVLQGVEVQQPQFTAESFSGRKGRANIIRALQVWRESLGCKKGLAHAVHRLTQSGVLP